MTTHNAVGQGTGQGNGEVTGEVTGEATGQVGRLLAARDTQENGQ